MPFFGCSVSARISNFHQMHGDGAPAGAAGIHGARSAAPHQIENANCMQSSIDFAADVLALVPYILFMMYSGECKFPFDSHEKLKETYNLVCTDGMERRGRSGWRVESASARATDRDGGRQIRSILFHYLSASNKKCI